MRLRKRACLIFCNLLGRGERAIFVRWGGGRFWCFIVWVRPHPIYLQDCSEHEVHDILDGATSTNFFLALNFLSTRHIIGQIFMLRWLFWGVKNFVNFHIKQIRPEAYSKLLPPTDAISAPPIRTQVNVLIGSVAPEKSSLQIPVPGIFFFLMKIPGTKIFFFGTKPRYPGFFHIWLPPY